MANPKQPMTWTLDLLSQIEWRRFEELCERLFEQKGFVCKTQSHGGDEGIDIYLYFGKEALVLDRIVQCKAWKKKVGVEPLRAFLGTIAAKQAKRGTFVSRSVEDCLKLTRGFHWKLTHP